jgi:hypothetical protein
MGGHEARQCSSAPAVPKKGNGFDQLPGHGPTDFTPCLQALVVIGYHGGIYGHYPPSFTQFIVDALRQHPDWSLNLEIAPDTWDFARTNTPEACQALKALIYPGAWRGVGKLGWPGRRGHSGGAPLPSGSTEGRLDLGNHGRL